MNNSSAPPTDSPGPRKWIVSPWFDLLFVINGWWILFWLPSIAEMRGSDQIGFWQVYFLSTPHRWLTLLLVASDPDRRQGRTRFFIGLAIVFGIIVSGTWAVTGNLLYLAVIDYIWNAYHFASQHAGVLRIYGRMAGGGRPRLETLILRVFVTYAALRLTSFVIGWTTEVPMIFSVIRTTDWIVVALPIGLCVLELVNRPWQRWGKVLHLGSVTALYSSLIFTVRDGHMNWTLALVVASAAFHAVEYMAIVTFYAWRRREQGSESPFRRMARHWTEVLFAFILCLGLLALSADKVYPEFWLGITLWVSYLHYAYDGMIWKLRRPETAKALNVAVSGSGSG